MGERVNYGAGSITANYDGANKHRTVIEADVHVGSNCVLVAPVTVAAGGTVGAGSVINKNTEAGARHRQAARLGALAERGAAADGAARADGDGRDEHAIAAHVHVGLDHRLVLVGPVVVGRDAARAVVDALAHRGVAQVRDCLLYTSDAADE